MCDRVFEEQSRGLMKNAAVPVAVSVIAAGKFRRYHGESLLQRVLDIKTNLLNLRDLVYIAVGFFQSIVHLISFKPDVVFAKGGYVCLPMGVAARLLSIPLVIHDSDMRPGLTNRVLSRFATKIATGAPTKYYSYPESITTHTGVPISDEFTPVKAQDQSALKEKLGVQPSRPLVVVTGGGLGARSINMATVKAASRLVERGVSIFHITGKRHYEDVLRAAVTSAHYKITPFVYKDMAKVLGAADVVVTRASATFMQELAGLKKPVIAVPAAHLGDQQKNATVFSAADAAVILQDGEIGRESTYEDALWELLRDESRRKELAGNLHEFAKPTAAHEVAELIISSNVAGGRDEQPQK